MERLNLIICNYISQQWIKETSNRSFAINHDIDEKTVRLIKDAEAKKYSMTMETLEKICASRELKLYEFFKLIDR